MEICVQLAWEISWFLYVDVYCFQLFWELELRVKHYLSCLMYYRVKLNIYTFDYYFLKFMVFTVYQKDICNI